jgi:LysR family transcriptional regulator, glycine cleavage system transcriptional activator
MAEEKKKVGLPPLDWLRVFEAAGRRGGFTAASQEFGLTQAAVSQRIRNLESWLGCALFLRSARGVSLTVEGESYLPLVRQALESLERSTEDLFGKAPRELRIAALSSHLDALVLPRVSGFLTARPEVRLVTESVSHRAGLEEVETDLQLRYGRGNWPGREAVLIQREVLVPMVAPALRDRAWGDLSAIEVRGERPGWHDWARETGGALPPAAGLSFDSMEHGLTAARQGLGVVLGSVPRAQENIEAGVLVLLEAGGGASGVLEVADGYWLSWSEDRFRSKKQRRMVDEFAAALVR